MERVYENGGDLKKTINAIEKSEDGKSVIRWLEEGTDTSGWLHILKKHITGEIPGGSKFPSSMNVDQVKELIYNSIKKGTKTETTDITGRKTILYEYIDEMGLKVKTIVGDNGYIVTSYPI